MGALAETIERHAEEERPYGIVLSPLTYERLRDAIDEDKGTLRVLIHRLAPTGDVWVLGELDFIAFEEELRGWPHGLPRLHAGQKSWN